MRTSLVRLRRCILLGSALGFILTVVVFLWLILVQQRPPRYRGLTVSEWSVKIDSLSSDELAAMFDPKDFEPVPFLIHALSFESSKWRHAYASLYPKLPVVMRDFLNKPVDPGRVRWESASLLARMGPKATQAMPALVVALSDPEDRVRLGASGALKVIRRHLGKQWPMDSRAVAALSSLIKDPNPGTRWNVASGIYVFGHSATNAIPFLELALQDPVEQVRRAATNSLREIKAMKAGD